MRDVLVPITEAYSRTVHMHYAARLARSLGTSLTGLYTLQPFLGGPEFNSPAVVSEAVAFLLEQRKAGVEGAAPFVEWARGHGVDRARWAFIQGMFASSVTQVANWHDVMVLQSDPESETGSVGTLGEVLLTCGVPCIVVPEQAAPADAPTRIAIAWNGSVESIRAVRAAFPLLDKATEITLLCGHRRASDPALTWNPSFDIAGYLQQHGYRVQQRMGDIDNERAGESLLAAATDVGAELLVMGAYGRGRFSEWVLGGATRHVLQHARLPLFLKH